MPYVMNAKVEKAENLARAILNKLFCRFELNLMEITAITCFL